MVQVYYFNKALKLVDLEKQPEMRDAYVHAIGGLAEALESMKLYEKANQSYDAALRVKVGLFPPPTHLFTYPSGGLEKGGPAVLWLASRGDAPLAACLPAACD